MTTHHPQESLNSELQNGRLFPRIAAGSVALAFGFLGASIASLRGGATGYVFAPSAGTFVAFAIGAAAGAFFYRRLIASGRAGARAGTFQWTSLALTLAGLGLFLYPLRFMPAEKLPDIAQGLAGVACALSLGGYLVWRLKRFFDWDEVANGKR